jgi:uncharacterized membrane protein YkoI
MDLKTSFEMLEKSGEFKKWRKNHQDSYLCSCFILLGEELVNKELSNWQFDFFVRKTGKIASFVVGKDKTKFCGEDDAFKRKETKVLELNLKNLKISLEKALESACKLKEAKSEKFEKKIVVLQNIDGSVIWNLSLLTDTFSILNIKVSANSGKVLSTERTSLLNFKAG